MRPRRTRKQAARDLRADLGEPMVDEAFVARLASVARTSTAAPTKHRSRRLRLAGAGIALSALTVSGGLGVAYGTGFVAPPWSSDTSPERPSTPSPSGTPDQSPSADPSEDIGGPGDPCLLYTSPSPRDGLLSRMPSSA